MKMTFTGSFGAHPRQIFRRAGYGEHDDPATGYTSYTLRTGRGAFPRFHAYVEEGSSGFTVNFHLDQKQPSYAGTSAHSGEYGGAVVEEEAARITRWVEYFRQ